MERKRIASHVYTHDHIYIIFVIIGGRIVCRKIDTLIEKRRNDNNSNNNNNNDNNNNNNAHADVICSDNFHSSVKHRLRFIPMIKEPFVRTDPPPLHSLPALLTRNPISPSIPKTNICFTLFPEISHPWRGEEERILVSKFLTIEILSIR